MFSDVVSDALHSIMDALHPRYASPSIYPKEVVVGMLCSMILTTLVSDATGPDGKYNGFKDINEMRRFAYQRALDIYNDKMNKQNRCCICSKSFTGYGNNPYPVGEVGKCCDDCNNTKVIPARIKMMFEKKDMIPFGEDSDSE